MLITWQGVRGVASLRDQASGGEQRDSSQDWVSGAIGVGSSAVRARTKDQLEREINTKILVERTCFRYIPTKAVR